MSEKDLVFELLYKKVNDGVTQMTVTNNEKGVTQVYNLKTIKSRKPMRLEDDDVVEDLKQQIDLYEKMGYGNMRKVEIWRRAIVEIERLREEKKGRGSR